MYITEGQQDLVLFVELYENYWASQKLLGILTMLKVYNVFKEYHKMIFWVYHKAKVKWKLNGKQQYHFKNEHNLVLIA